MAVTVSMVVIPKEDAEHLIRAAELGIQEVTKADPIRAIHLREVVERVKDAVIHPAELSTFPSISTGSPLAGRSDGEDRQAFEEQPASHCADFGV